LKEAPVSAAYDGRQFVGIDLHRRRSVVSRTDQHGNVLEAVRISNDPHMLAEVMGRAGEQPEVVLEATMAGTGRRTCWPRSVPTCTWRTRWG
jgi:hypothetical protein